MSDALRRAIRTFVQGFIGVLVLMAIPALQNLIGDAADGQIDIDLNFWFAIVVAAIAGGVISLISFVQNWLEDNTNVPSVLKATASSGANPVTHDTKV